MVGGRDSQKKKDVGVKDALFAGRSSIAINDQRGLLTSRLRQPNGRSTRGGYRASGTPHRWPPV